MLLRHAGFTASAGLSCYILTSVVCHFCLGPESSTLTCNVLSDYLRYSSLSLETIKPQLKSTFIIISFAQ